MYYFGVLSTSLDIILKNVLDCFFLKKKNIILGENYSLALFFIIVFIVKMLSLAALMSKSF